MIIGTITCKAFLPVIYLLSLFDVVLSVIILTIVSIILWRKLKNANRPNN